MRMWFFCLERGGGGVEERGERGKREGKGIGGGEGMRERDE